MEKNICGECGTENEMQYVYCKNCGTKLTINKENPTENQNDYNNAGPEFIDSTGGTDNNEGAANIGNDNYTHSANQTNTVNNTVYNRQNSNYFPTDSIDGIPTDEVVLFMGKKAYDILPKFTKMEITRSKVTWCWPAAVLGFILGPAGAALWFFYRKMYKIALILLAIGVVVTTAVAIMTYNTNSSGIESILGAINGQQPEEVIGALSEIDVKESILDIAANLLERTVNIATCILTGLFGFYFYKEHCVNKIRNFRAAQTDQRYYRMGIASLGGVSGGMLALGIFVFILINNTASFITLIVSRLYN